MSGARPLRARAPYVTEEVVDLRELPTEIIKRILILRKTTKLTPLNRTTVYYETTAAIERLIRLNYTYIACTMFSDMQPAYRRKLTDLPLKSDLIRTMSGSLELVLTVQIAETILPKYKWANFQLIGMTLHHKGTLRAKHLLEVEGVPLSLEKLEDTVMIGFGVLEFKLVKRSGVPVRNEEIINLSGSTIFIVPPRKLPCSNDTAGLPCQKMPQQPMQQRDNNPCPPEVDLLSERDHKFMIDKWVLSTHRPY